MLRSQILAGNVRLERAASGGPSVKRRPPDDDKDAVQRIQRALKDLGYRMPRSFKTGKPDGLFGDEAYLAIVDFQRHAFPEEQVQWDGRAGRLTLAKLDEALTGSNESLDAPPDSKIVSVEQVTLPIRGFV